MSSGRTGQHKSLIVVGLGEYAIYATNKTGLQTHVGDK